MACGPEITGGGPGGREPPRDEPRDPKRKKEKPREVKILWNSSAKPGTGGGGHISSLVFAEGGGGTKARGPVACGLEITGGVRGGGSPPG